MMHQRVLTRQSRSRPPNGCTHRVVAALRLPSENGGMVAGLGGGRPLRLDNGRWVQEQQLLNPSAGLIGAAADWCVSVPGADCRL